MTKNVQGNSRDRQKVLRAWLEREIAEGKILPGQRIDEPALCARFDVSRTPVREALLQLASMELVEFRPRQGAVVAQMTVEQIAAMWEVLANLEGLCAELSARRMTPDDIEGLRAIQSSAKALVKSGDVMSYAEANKEFHEALYNGARNEFLTGHVRSIRNRMNAYRRYPFQKAGGIQRSFDGHQRVLEAIVSGNHKQADAAMREHVAGAMDFLDIVAELKERISAPEKVQARVEAKEKTMGVKSSRRKGRKASIRR